MRKKITAQQTFAVVTIGILDCYDFDCYVLCFMEWSSGRKKMYDNEIIKYANDILESDNFKSTKKYIQHGNMSVQEHCIHVAKASLYIMEKLNIKCNTEDLVRGALLHDYFLYDWHNRDKANPHGLHGFCHPSRALCNARKEYNLTARQIDIIIKHMWPLTIIPPMCREAWIVTSADKYCSLMETFYIHKGKIHDRKMIKTAGHNDY